MPWIDSHKRKNYVRMSYLALVKWADRDRIKSLYSEARFLSEATGVAHVVDHIIPLCRPDVCGLTVHYNLRVIPYKRNALELNHWSERLGEIFSEQEQLAFFTPR